MAEENGDRRLSLSESRVKDIVETAVLRLQVELGKLYATTEDVKRIETAVTDSVKQAQNDIRIVSERDTGRFKEMQEEIDSLKEDKAGRDAVTNFKKWLIGGSLLATVFMAIQVAISLYLVTRGARK